MGGLCRRLGPGESIVLLHPTGDWARFTVEQVLPLPYDASFPLISARGDPVGLVQHIERPDFPCRFGSGEANVRIVADRTWEIVRLAPRLCPSTRFRTKTIRRQQSLRRQHFSRMRPRS